MFNSILSLLCRIAQPQLPAVNQLSCKLIISLNKFLQERLLARIGTLTHSRQEMLSKGVAGKSRNIVGLKLYTRMPAIDGVDGKDRVIGTLDGRDLPHTEQVSCRNSIKYLLYGVKFIMEDFTAYLALELHSDV